jgi:hypothetical protein
MARYETKIKEGAAPFLEDGEEVWPRSWLVRADGRSRTPQLAAGSQPA